MRPALLALLVVPLTVGCVGKARYDASQNALQAARSKNAELEEQAAQLRDDLRAANQEVEDAEARIALLEDQIADTRLELQAVEQQLEEERGEKAELVKARSRMKASIEEMTAALEDLARRKALAEKRIQEFRDLVARFKDLIDAGKLQVRILDGRMVVQLATDVLFASGSASLSKEGRDAVREVADVLKAIPDRSFQVEGHTDNVPIATERYPSNWELASGRAITVVREMLDVGMAPERLSASSYAEFDPVASNRTKEGKAANRRIQIVVIPDLSTLPGYEELSGLADED